MIFSFYYHFLYPLISLLALSIWRGLWNYSAIKSKLLGADTWGKVCCKWYSKICNFKLMRQFVYSIQDHLQVSIFNSSYKWCLGLDVKTQLFLNGNFAYKWDVIINISAFWIPVYSVCWSLCSGGGDPLWGP